MKIAVINFSGNVGKSTIARHLLKPRMPDAGIVAVETINADSATDQKIKGKDFGRLQEDLQLEESAIVDVGASNVEQFMALMRMYKGSHTDFDLYLVPTVPTMKQQRDTGQCVQELRSIGVPAKKILVIFNQLEPGEDFQKAFMPIISFAKHTQSCIIDKMSVIYKSDIFSLIRDAQISIEEIVSDQTDLRAAINKEADKEMKVELVRQLSIKRLGIGVKENLDQVFERIQLCLHE